MIKDSINAVTGLISFAVLATFIIGLAYSISTGFAGFWGGFPFWVIIIFVLGLAAYDYWDQCLRKRR
jgi:sterol desaturase/sphingolipid hydroxylase (fatty acid hydroxylase superfamily)